MTARNLTSVKKSLALAFPGVAFNFGAAGRGLDRGHLIEWTGGLTAVDVRAASDLPARAAYHFRRTMDAAEWADYMVAEDAARPAREAAEAVAKIARKAAGAVKAAATHSATRRHAQPPRPARLTARQRVHGARYRADERQASGAASGRLHRSARFASRVGSIALRSRRRGLPGKVPSRSEK